MRAKGLLLISLPLAALVIVVSFSFLLQSDERSTRAVDQAATIVDSAATAMLVTSLNGETGTRGYAATGDTSFLEPYYQAVAARLGDDRALSAAAGTAGVRGTALTLIKAFNQRFIHLRQTRELVAAHGSRATIDTQLRAGKKLEDQLRAEVATIIGRESAVATLGNDRIASLERWFTIADLLGLLLGLLAAVAGVSLFASGVTRRLNSTAKNAERLGRGEPLVFQYSSGDDFDRLDDALRQAEDQLALRSREISQSRDETVEALELNRIKNEFLSRTSHELRTPLNAILGFSQLLEMSDLDEADRDSNEQILIAGRHLLSLINDILDLSRIESNEVRLSLEPVSVASVVGDVVDLMRPLAEQRGITIANECANPSLAAQSDRQRFKQILLNLMSNAVKYNRPHGAIAIECRTDGDSTVTVTISDTGLGLSADDLERIFSPFERLQAMQTEVEGAGIGLAVSAELAKAMAGRISVESEPGKGSKFTLELPRAPDISIEAGIALRPPARKPFVEATSADTLATTKVLYIEDNAANLQLVQMFFERRYSATILVAQTGQLGLQLAREHHPDVILLDRHLPDQLGGEVLDQLRADPRTADIPVIMISADASPVTVKRLLAKGALAYLTKPIDFSALEALLGALEAPRAPKAS